MARLAYADIDEPGAREVADRIRHERSGKVPNLYRMLLKSPPVADGWRAFLTAIRQQGTLSSRIREIVILRIAVINGADYEFQAHVPFARAAGVTDDEIAALKASRVEGFAAADRALIAYTDSLTRDVRVPAHVFADVAQVLGDRDIVELTATIGAYNLVSRFLVALEIDHD